MDSCPHITVDYCILSKLARYEWIQAMRTWSLLSLVRPHPSIHPSVSSLSANPSRQDILIHNWRRPLYFSFLLGWWGWGYYLLFWPTFYTWADLTHWLTDGLSLSLSRLCCCCSSSCCCKTIINSSSSTALLAASFVLNNSKYISKKGKGRKLYVCTYILLYTYIDCCIRRIKG